MRTWLIAITTLSFALAPRGLDAQEQESARAEESESGSDESADASAADAAEPNRTESDPGPLPPDLAPIRDEYVRLMDDMVQARSRVALLGEELFQSRMRVQFQDRTGDEATLERVLVELDGAPVFRSDGPVESGDDGRQVFDGAVAPGPHVLVIEMEERGRRDPEYRTIRRESFRFIVVRERLTEVRITVEDDTNIDESFSSNGEGHFETKTRVRVAARPLRSEQ